MIDLEADRADETVAAGEAGAATGVAASRAEPRHETRTLVAELIEHDLAIAVAESLTGGALAAELVTVPGVSTVLRGGVVSYDTRVKHRVLGVDGGLLRERGPVHPEVALQMARGVREVCAVDDGRGVAVPARLGLATTGVAGPGAADGHAAGEVFIAAVLDGDERVRHLRLSGDRDAVRAGAVHAAIALAREAVAALRGDRSSAGAAGSAGDPDAASPGGTASTADHAVQAFKANSKALDAGREEAAR